jgi:hypothetical protein
MIAVLYAASPCRTRAGLNIGSGETRPSASGSVAPNRWGTSVADRPTSAVRAFQGRGMAAGDGGCAEPLFSLRSSASPKDCRRKTSASGMSSARLA